MTRIKPIELRPTFHFGNYNTDGALTIYPRPGSTRHAIGGHFYLGDVAHPFTGSIEGLALDYAPSAPPGRPPKTARDVGVYLAYESFLQNAQRDLPMPQAQGFSKRKCMELWKKWPGISDEKALRRARKNALDALEGKRALLTYTGTTPDFSDYVALLLLPGASYCMQAGTMQVQGPAWLWRWGQEVAEHTRRINATVSGFSTPDHPTVFV